MKYSSDIFNALLAMVLGGGSGGGGGSVTVVETTVDPQTSAVTFGTKAGELYELCQAGPVSVRIEVIGAEFLSAIIQFVTASGDGGGYYEFDYYDTFTQSIVPAIALSADDYPTYTPSQS